MSRFGFVAGLSFLALSSTADAQVWGRGPVPREGACFYRDADYRGQYFCVPAGEGLRNLPRAMRDNISSIRVTGRADVTVFDGPSFRGQARRIEDDVRNLARAGGWNDAISSVRVEREGFSRGQFGNRGDDRFGRDRDDDRVGRGPGRGFGNVDIVVRRAYQDVLGREPDPEGMRVYRSHMIDEGWSEAQVRDALRNSREFREMNRMTSVKAREIVRNAYLSVLRREPDAASEPYVNRVLRENWTQQDVERELRRSPEFRTRGR